MSLPGERCQVNVGNAAHFHVIKSQTSDKVRGASLVLEISLTEVACVLIESDSELCPSFGCGKFYVHIASVDTFLEDLDGLRGTKTHLDWVRSCSQALHQVIHGALFGQHPTPVGLCLRRSGGLFHLLTQNERSHIGPYLFDIG